MFVNPVYIYVEKVLFYLYIRVLCLFKTLCAIKLDGVVGADGQ